MNPSARRRLDPWSKSWTPIRRPIVSPPTLGGAFKGVAFSWGARPKASAPERICSPGIRLCFSSFRCGVSPAVESLKLRRMRVRNDISLSTEGGADRAEDLEALLEELRRLSKQIEEAEH